ncbi:MAG TPA: dienelactone hydrolase family protein, partial [Allocoleopsis sp.]
MRKWLGLAIAGFLLVLSSSWLSVSRSLAIPQSDSQPNYGQHLLQLHQDDRPVASPLVAQAPAVPVTTESVVYATIDGKPITGYLARPAESSENLPAILVIHEWWGLNDNIKQMTQRLAGEGYTALAVDLYEGQVADTPEQARVLVEAARQNPDRVNQHMAQAYQYLETEQQAPKIASLGWCFGGGVSLQTALLLPDQLDAAVIYYGRLETDPEVLRPLEMPILGIFGSLDENPSVDSVKQFEAALNSLKKPAEIHIYEGANHAFANPSGTRY